MIDWKTVKRTNILAVDLCMNEIYSCRRKGVPLKAIYLWPEMFGQFKKWVEDGKKGEIIGYERTLQRAGLKEEYRSKLQEQLEVLRTQLAELDTMQLEMDGVVIALGDRPGVQPKPLLCELWEERPKELAKQFFMKHFSKS